MAKTQAKRSCRTHAVEHSQNGRPRDDRILRNSENYYEKGKVSGLGWEMQEVDPNMNYSYAGLVPLFHTLPSILETMNWKKTKVG